MKISCPENTKFQDVKLYGESTVFAECGPEIDTFSVKSKDSEFITKLSGKKFGCGMFSIKFNDSRIEC